MLDHTDRACLEPVIDLVILMTKGVYVWVCLPGPDCVIYGAKLKHGFTRNLQRVKQHNVWTVTAATMHHHHVSQFGS